MKEFLFIPLGLFLLLSLCMSVKACDDLNGRPPCAESEKMYGNCPRGRTECTYESVLDFFPTRILVCELNRRHWDIGK